jgi:hypothetical protein
VVNGDGGAAASAVVAAVVLVLLLLVLLLSLFCIKTGNAATKRLSHHDVVWLLP